MDYLDKEAVRDPVNYLGDVHCMAIILLGAYAG